MNKFIGGIVLANFLNFGTDIIWTVPYNIEYGKMQIYSHSCKVKCGKNYIDVSKDHQYCMCKGGTYKRDLNNLYK